MKSTELKWAILPGIVLLCVIGSSQVNTSSTSKKSNTNKMESTNQHNNNKTIITSLYEEGLNKKNFTLFPTIISPEYTGVGGLKGAEGFTKQLKDLIAAFPDASWKIEDMVAEGNKVTVKQVFKGTHKGSFQQISATNKTVANSGIAIYELKDGKIISNFLLTDRVSFLQQVGVLPADLIPLHRAANKTEIVNFVDKFFVPKAAIEEFTQRMQYNRNFIHKLPGFIGDEVLISQDTDGNYSVITIAKWEDPSAVEAAKQQVQQEYARTGFDPAAFQQKHNIKLERGVYKSANER